MLHLIFTVLYCNGITSMKLSAWVCMLMLLQVAEDKTFGLKNKNKSAKVQQCAADLLFAHLPSEFGFIVGFALCASYSASAMRRYVQHVKKTVDDQVQSRKQRQMQPRCCCNLGISMLCYQKPSNLSVLAIPSCSILST